MVAFSALIILPIFKVAHLAAENVYVGDAHGAPPRGENAHHHRVETLR
jgi:hypothetical protein